MHPIAKFIIRHARLISMLGAGIALIATVFTTLLYMNLRPDIEELLPTSSRSVKDLMEVRRRMNAIENFTVLLFSDDKVQARKFATDLAHELQTKPRSLIYRVDY
ncbi:MAG: hypothetical protein ACXWPM_09265, partial [Bdellovibrionota bacterium]